jgi:hypothetical protein
MAGMTIEENLTEFAGLPVQDFAAGATVTADRAWRVRVDYDPEAEWLEVFEQFAGTRGASEVRAFIIGSWGEVGTGTDSAQIVEAVVAARERLPSLKALFIGDIVRDESEISWIHQSDMSPILSAYAAITHFQVRGGTGLSLGSLRHRALRTLVVESGGLDASVVRQVAAADLPSLEHLELWLGDSGYGANWTMDDLGPLLTGERLPSLKTLALRDSEQADAVAKAVAVSPLLERLEVLDLSLGVLTDGGAAALVASGAVKKLKRLDLHHHFLTEAMMRKLADLGIPVDISDAESPDSEYRFVAVSE